MPGPHPIMGFLVWRFCRVGVILLGIAALARAQASPATAAGPGTTPVLLPPCAQIAASGPRFAPLAQACQYALSPDRLPDFVCDEKVQEFSRRLGDGKWMTRPDDVKWTTLAVITEQVAFEQGKGTQYAKVAIKGRPVRKLAGWHSDWDTWEYLRHKIWGWSGDINFGTDLRQVFTPQNHTSFDYKNEIEIENTPLVVFMYTIRKPSGKTRTSNFMPGLTIEGIGPQYPSRSVLTGLMGLLWFDKNTSSLRRVVSHWTEIDPTFPIYAYATATDYGLVTITDVGQFLLPIGGEDLLCDKQIPAYCWRNIVTFNNCHKFAAKSRIVPAK